MSGSTRQPEKDGSQLHRMWYPPDLSDQTKKQPRSWSRGMSNRQIAISSWNTDQIQMSGFQTCGKKIQCSDEDGTETYAYCLEFNPSGQLCIGTETGQIGVLETFQHRNEEENRLWRRLGEWSAHQNAIYDLKWMPGGKLVSVAGDNNLCLWDAKSEESVARVKPPKVTEHQGCMKCLAVAPGGAPTLASGGRDNSIICWDMRVPQPAVLNVVKYSHQPMTAATSISAAAASKSKKGQQGVTKASVTALEYIDDHHLVSCSDLDGEVKVWDLRMSYDRYKGLPKCKHSIPYAGTSSLMGYSSLVLNSAKTKVYVSCQDHTIYRFDVAQCDNLRPEKEFKGHTNTPRFYTKVSLSLDDRYLVTGSSDNHAYVYNTGAHAPSRPLGKLTGHTADVTCVAFTRSDQDPHMIATTSDDCTVKFWKNHGGRLLRDIRTEEVKEAEVGEFEPVSSLDDYLAVCRDFRQDALLDQKENQSQHEQPPAAKRPRRCNPLSETNAHQKPLRLEPFPCSSPVKIEMSPSKRPFTSHTLNVTPKKRKLSFSPMKSPSRRAAAPWASPTINLPNLVVDGKSPHNKAASAAASVRRPRRALDWLSAMSKEKKKSTLESAAVTSPSPKPSKSTATKTAASTPRSGRKRKRL